MPVLMGLQRLFEAGSLARRFALPPALRKGRAIRKIAKQPTLAALANRIHTRKAITTPVDTARPVREERAAR